jgi:hypothetical protein
LWRQEQLSPLGIMLVLSKVSLSWSFLFFSYVILLLFRFCRILFIVFPFFLFDLFLFFTSTGVLCCNGSYESGNTTLNGKDETVLLEANMSVTPRTLRFFVNGTQQPVSLTNIPDSIQFAVSFFFLLFYSHSFFLYSSFSSSLSFSPSLYRFLYTRKVILSLCFVLMLWVQRKGLPCRMRLRVTSQQAVLGLKRVFQLFMKIRRWWISKYTFLYLTSLPTPHLFFSFILFSQQNKIHSFFLHCLFLLLSLLFFRSGRISFF